MFPPAKPRKPDRLDELSKNLPLGVDEYEEAKAEFTRIRKEVRSVTDSDGAVVLGVDHPRGNDQYRFEFRLPRDAEWFNCDVKDLQGVLRRMCKSRELKYETFEWAGDSEVTQHLKGQIWKWYVKREDWDAKKRGNGSRAVGSKSGAGDSGGDIQPEWDGGATLENDAFFGDPEAEL